MFWRWRFTVPSAMSRATAISLLESPRATRASTSSSRRVSVGRPPGAPRSRVNSWRMRSATDREIRGSRCFRRYPCAPHRIASNRSWGSSDTVRTTTSVDGSSSLMRRMASNPSRRGIRRSMRTRSGTSSRTRVIPSAPSPASATTSKRGEAARMARIPRRASSLLSTITVRVATPPSYPTGRGDAERHLRAPARPGPDRDVSPDRAGVFPEGEEPVAPLGGTGEGIREAAPVVGEGEDCSGGSPLDPDVDPPGPGVLGHVVEGLADDGHGVQGRLQGQGDGPALLLDGGLEGVDLREAGDVAPHPRAEGLPGIGARPEVKDRLAHPLGHVPDRRGDLPSGLPRAPRVPAREGAFERGGPDAQEEECLRDAVVELPGDALPLGEDSLLHLRLLEPGGDRLQAAIGRQEDEGRGSERNPRRDSVPGPNRQEAGEHLVAQELGAEDDAGGEEDRDGLEGPEERPRRAAVAPGSSGPTYPASGLPCPVSHRTTTTPAPGALALRPSSHRYRNSSQAPRQYPMRGRDPPAWRAAVGRSCPRSETGTPVPHARRGNSGRDGGRPGRHPRIASPPREVCRDLSSATVPVGRTAAGLDHPRRDSTRSSATSSLTSSPGLSPRTLRIRAGIVVRDLPLTVEELTASSSGRKAIVPCQRSRGSVAKGPVAKEDRRASREVAP